MKVQFHSPDLEGAQWRFAAQRRVHESLHRLRSVVRRVKVRLDDVNGDRPGVDKRCRVEAELPGGRARVDATARGWQEALEAAVSRLHAQVTARLRRTARADADAGAAPGPGGGARPVPVPVPVRAGEAPHRARGVVHRLPR